jgi:hypothetical protein
MENKLLSSPVSDSPTEATPAEERSCPAEEALTEVRKAIVADCRHAPGKYLEEIEVAASGE